MNRHICTEGQRRAGTEAERYPLIKSPIYRRCVEDVIRHVRGEIMARGGVESLKSSPIIQLAKAGNLTADFMLAHFAGIFDKTSPLPSGVRRAVRAILTDAAQKMAQMKEAVTERARAEQEAAGNGEPG